MITFLFFPCQGIRSLSNHTLCVSAPQQDSIRKLERKYVIFLKNGAWIAYSKAWIQGLKKKCIFKNTSAVHWAKSSRVIDLSLRCSHPITHFSLQLQRKRTGIQFSDLLMQLHYIFNCNMTKLLEKQRNSDVKLKKDEQIKVHSEQRKYHLLCFTVSCT